MILNKINYLKIKYQGDNYLIMYILKYLILTRKRILKDQLLYIVNLKLNNPCYFLVRKTSILKRLIPYVCWKNIWNLLIDVYLFPIIGKRIL